jgi:hypothetical protein
LPLAGALAGCFIYGPTANSSTPPSAVLQEFPRNASDPSGVDAGPIVAFMPDAGPVDAGFSDAGTSDAGSVDAGPPDAGPLPFRPLQGPGGVPWGNTIGGEHDAPFQSLGTRTGNISGTGTIELVTGGVAVQTINTGMVATNLISHQQRWTKDLQHPIGSGHFVSDGTVVCALTYPSAGNAAEQLVCMRLTDGMVVLNALPGRAFTPDPDLAIHDGAIYIASTNHDSVGYLQAYDLQGGQQLFERAVQPHHRALVFAGQRVLVEGAPCPATQAGCIEALDERSGVVKATFPVAKSITFLWQKNGKPYFRSPNFQTVTYDTAKDAFLDVSSDFASLNAHAVPPGTFGNGDFDLYGWSDPMADGAV